MSSFLITFCHASDYIIGLKRSEFMMEIEKSRSLFFPGCTMNFFVDPSDGHDDYLMSLALLEEATGDFKPREARGK
jgi:hypothetical protein